jgi:hypothetical protein
MYAEIILREEAPDPVTLGPVVRREVFEIEIPPILLRDWSAGEIAVARFARAVAIMKGRA